MIQVMYIGGPVPFNKANHSAVNVGLRTETNAWCLQDGRRPLNGWEVPVHNPVKQGHEHNERCNQDKEKCHIAADE